MRFLADARLYSSTEHCLAVLTALGDEPDPGPEGPRERFHLFWQGDFGSKQAFVLTSILATQSAPHVDLWLWLERDSGYPGHEENPYLQPLLDRVAIRCFDAEVEASDTPLAKRLDLYDVAPRARSDFFRHVVLYRYGGTYLDFDIMLLRDLRILRRLPGCDGELCYAWSDRPYANTAFLRLHEGSETARRLLDRCVERGSCHPKNVAVFTDEDLDLLVLPAPVVDPLWLVRDGKDTYESAPIRCWEDFFAPLDPERANSASTLDGFFPGAFGYHWHNCWTAPEPDSSYFGLFRASFERHLALSLQRTS